MRTRSLHWAAAVPVAILGGTALDAATPWLEWWPLGIIGAALVLAAVWQQKALVGLVFGLLAGAAFWFPHLSWLTLYLGPVPWVALSGVMTLWFGGFGVFAAVATRGLALSRVPVQYRVVAQVLAVAGLWVLREQLQGVWPYGGFAWGRLAHTQASGPLASLASWGGFTGLSGVLALIAALLVACWFIESRSPRLNLPSIARRSLVPATAVLVVVMLSYVPIARLPVTDTLTVAAIQGNSKSGIFDDRENGDVFQAHLEVTEHLLGELESTGHSVDVIVWPENSAEFDVRSHPSRSAALRRLAEQSQTSIVVGSILEERIPGSQERRFTNSIVVYDEHGLTDSRYDKRRPVPFAEYMPNREFFRTLVPDLVDLVQLEYDFGELPTVLQLEKQNAAFTAGIAICFDIIFDDQAKLMAAEGAQVIFAPTNNADFGLTDQSAQQLQIARLRAVESGRAVVNISTVGTSAVIAPDGSDLAKLKTHTPASMVVEVPLIDGLTPAMRWGSAIAAAWGVIGLAGFAAGAAALIRHRSRV